MGNFDSRYNPTQGLTEQQLQYLRDLSPVDKRQAMAALGQDPIIKPRTPSGSALDNPYTLLTKDQYDLLIKKCYRDICSGTLNEQYLKVIIIGLPERVKMDEQGAEQAKFQAIITGLPERVKTDKMGVEKAMEHLVSLASRMVKGEECLWCKEEYVSPTRGPAELHQHFAQAMKKLDEISQERGIKWTMSGRSQFALDRLGSIHPTYYQPVQYLLEHGVYRVNPENEMYQTMWCHDNENWYDDEEEGVSKFTCHCWDVGTEGSHMKFCYWDEDGEGSGQVYV